MDDWRLLSIVIRSRRRSRQPVFGVLSGERRCQVSGDRGQESGVNENGDPVTTLSRGTGLHVARADYEEEPDPLLVVTPSRYS